MSAVTVAALFVAKGGCYFGLDGVDPWDEERDARKYAGPYPVVAHPPCGPWGVFARQGKTLRKLGDDDGCFAAAVQSVRTWGGVLEHPARSSAWTRHGLPVPLRGWTREIMVEGWSCQVEQGRYGGPCRKPTWLYCCRARQLPSLDWHNAHAQLDAFDSLGKTARAATPPAFRDMLLALARSSAPPEGSRDR